MRRLIFSSRSKADLEELRTYIAGEKPVAAMNFAERLVQACRSPLDFPDIGRLGRREGTRELVVPPYVIVYRATTKAVTIERILHGAQRR